MNDFDRNLIQEILFVRSKDDRKLSELALKLQFIFNKDRPKYDDIIISSALNTKLKNHLNYKLLLIRMLYLELDDSDRELIERLTQYYKDNKEYLFKAIDYDVALELLKYANFLAEMKYIDIAMDILIKVKKIQGNIKEDDYKLKQMNNFLEDGDSRVPIDTIYGWLAWGLMKCTVNKGRKYIDAIINIAAEFSKNDNLYVKYSSIWILTQLTHSRLTHDPKNIEILFLDNDRQKALQKSKIIEQMILEVIEDISKKDKNIQKSFAHNLTYCLNNIRALNDDDAGKVLKLIQKYEDNPEALKEFIPILVYFAFIRKWAFTVWRYKEKGLYDDLNPFNADEKYFNYLKNLIQKNNEILNKNISHNIMSLAIADKKGKFNNLPDLELFKKEYIKKAIELFKNMMNRYNDHIFFSVFEFIRVYISTKTVEVYELLENYMRKESESFKTEPHKNYYARHQIDDSILVPVLKNLGEDESIKILKLFLDYPYPPVYQTHKNVLSKTLKICENKARENNEFKDLLEQLSKTLSEWIIGE